MIKSPSLIILNGPCSAGKTTISKALQDLLPSTDPNILLGIDAYHLAIPPSKLSLATADPNYFIPHVIEGKKKTVIVHGPYIEAINRARYQAAACFLKEGITIVADELFWKQEDLMPLIDMDVDNPVYLIGIDVSIQEGELREQRRSQKSDTPDVSEDYRPTGMSLASQVTHDFMQYDYRLDVTYLSPKECANKILNYIESTNTPQSLVSLRKLYR